MTQEQGRMRDYTGRVSDEISDDVSNEPVSYTLGDTNYEQSDENKSSDAIKADIEQTRSEMSQKINQIQDRLDPTRLKEQAQETVRSAVTDSTDAIVGFVRNNAGDFGYTVVDTIKRNPVPAALIGIGLGWMIFKSFSSSSSDWQDNDDYTYGERYNGGRSMGSGSAQYSRQYGTDYGDQSRYSYEEGGQSLSGQYQGGQYQGGSRYGGAQSSGYSTQSSYGTSYSSGSSGQEEQGRVSQVVQSAQEKASDVVGQARDTAGQLTEQVQETAQQAGQYVQGMVGQVREQASHLGEQAQQTLQGTGSQVQRTVENNPVPFGVAALVAGVLVGLALPSTQAENQIMGEKRDQLIDNAQSVAQDVKERVQSVVEEKLPEVKQTAQKVADDLKQTGKTAAADIKQTLKEAGDSTKQSVNDVAQASKDAAQDATQSAANKMSTTTSGSASYTGSTTVGSTTTGSTSGTSSLTGGSTESSSAPEEEGSTKNSRM